MTEADKQSVQKKSVSDQKGKPSLSSWEGSSSVVNQGRHWSSALIWTGAALLTSAIVWGFTARIDQTITVRGRLVPAGRVRKVDSPSGGVISEVFVEEGQLVSEGDSLFTVEAKGLDSRREALKKVLKLFSLQAEGLKGILVSDGDPSRLPPLPVLPDVNDPELMTQLISAGQQTKLIRSQLVQNAIRLKSLRQTLKLQEDIGAALKPLYEEGAMARNQYLLRLNQIQEIKADLATREEELSKIVGQAAAQLNQINRQMISLRAELVDLKERISYRTVKAPIDGKIFDSKIKAYSVVSTSQTVLSLVPEKRLEASVVISDADIGFVKVGMIARVAVDSFPSGEFGYINGEVKTIAIDSLPPSGESQLYTFPASISLKEQTVLAGENKLNLQSGMGVSANIKLRSRPVITILTDMFTKQLDGLKRFR